MAQHHLNDLEDSVIGGILLRPEVLAQLDWLEPRHFRQASARMTFAAMRNLESASQPIDVVTVESAIARGNGGTLPDGALAYLGEAQLRVPTTDNVEEYARQLRDATLARDVRRVLVDIIDAAERDESNGAELLSMAHAGISKLGAETPDDAKSIGKVITARFAQLEQIANDRESGKRTMTGYPTGVAELDDRTGGWQAGIVSIVAARPGMGKSSLGLSTADACSAAAFGAHVFSLEDTEAAYADRTISRTSEVPAESMRNAKLDRGSMAAIGRVAPMLRKRPWLLDGRSGITADEIVRSVRKHRKANDTRVVIVDYVQLVKRPPRMSPHEALTEIVTTLADAAKHDGIAYVVMRPMLSDLRESGSLEERAKCVVAIYRGSFYGPDSTENVDWGRGWGDGHDYVPDPEHFARHCQLIVLKNSNGRSGLVWATFEGSTTRLS